MPSINYFNFFFYFYFYFCCYVKIPVLPLVPQPLPTAVGGNAISMQKKHRAPILLGNNLGPEASWSEWGPFEIVNLLAAPNDPSPHYGETSFSKSTKPSSGVNAEVKDWWIADADALPKLRPPPCTCKVRKLAEGWEG